MLTDKKDLKILIELDENPRKSYSAIGKSVRLSKQAVSSRIEKLVSEGVITTFVAFINMNAFGITPIKVFFSFQNINSTKKEEIITFLKKDKVVGGLMVFEGLYDLFAGIMTQNQIELEEFLSRFYSKFSNNIKEKKIVTLVDSSVFPRGYLREDKTKPLIKPRHFFIHPAPRPELKPIDYRIIEEITKNPIIKPTMLAKNLHTGVQTVINRMKKLEKESVINGYGILINEKMFVSYVLLVELNNFTKEIKESIFNFAKGHPNFILLVRVIGEWNYEFGIEGNDLQECLRAIEDFKKKFADVIRSCVPLLIQKIEKMENYK